MKLQKEFEFNYPLTQKAVRDLKIVTEHVGDLNISGVAYMYPNESVISGRRYDYDIDHIKWNGTDVKSLLEAIGDTNEICEATLAHAAYVFNNKDENVEVEEKRERSPLFEQVADMCHKYNKAFYGVDTKGRE